MYFCVNLLYNFNRKNKFIGIVDKERGKMPEPIIEEKLLNEYTRIWNNMLELFCIMYENSAFTSHELADKLEKTVLYLWQSRKIIELYNEMIKSDEGNHEVEAAIQASIMKLVHKYMKLVIEKNQLNLLQTIIQLDIQDFFIAPWLIKEKRNI